MSAASKLVAAAASYPAYATPDLALEFEPDTVIVQAETGNAFISFDGVTDHISVMNTQGPLTLSTKRTKFWVKQNGGAANVRLMAFTVR